MEIKKLQKKIAKQLLKDIQRQKNVYKRNEAIRSYVMYTKEIRAQTQF